MGFAEFICRNVLFTYLVAHMVKNLPVVQETWVQSLGQGDSLEKGMVTHPSILAPASLIFFASSASPSSEASEMSENLAPGIWSPNQRGLGV